VVTTTPGPGWYRTAFGAPFYGLHRRALQELLAAAAGAEHLRLGCQASALARDWVTGGDDPAALHQPAGPATAARDAYLAEAPDWLAWIHGYDALA
jgi:hypothetical protein